MAVQVRVKLKNRLLPILVAILFVLTIIDSYPGWRLLLSGLGGAWLISYIWARSMAQNVRIRREMRFGWAQVGDQLEERFTLTNSHWIPCLWCEVIDHSDMPGYKSSRVTAVGGGERNRWRSLGLCTHRGIFTLGPTSLRMSDPLHVYGVEISESHSMSLMVTPPVVPLGTIEVAPGGRVGMGRPLANAPERTVSAAGVREYIPGDSMRWVHWRTTARRDDFYVRLFESTPAGDWWIILDVDNKVQTGAEPDSTEEHAVILAASLADRGLRLGRAVGLVAHGDPLIWLPPKDGDGQRWEILRSLAQLTPADQPLVNLITGIRPTLGRNTSVVIITPNVDGDWVRGLLPLIWAGAAPTVMLLDPQSYGATKSSLAILALLARWSIHRYMITPDTLNRSEARPGRQGHLDWRVSPSGRVVLAGQQSDLAWKELS